MTQKIQSFWSSPSNVIKNSLASSTKNYKRMKENERASWWREDRECPFQLLYTGPDKCNQESRFKTRERLNFQFSQELTIKQHRERRKLHFDGIVLSGFFFSPLLLLMQVQSKKVKPSWFCFVFGLSSVGGSTKLVVKKRKEGKKYIQREGQHWWCVEGRQFRFWM